MESQQHALCDVTEILMDLRRLVAAHGEFLANFRHHTLTEEPPDSLDERSPPHPPWHTQPPDQHPVAAPPQCWTLPPSITQPPLGFKAEPIPRLRVDPPRFDGDNAQDWIHKIQHYYNNQYMPLHDRLYLTQFLFDHPASEWMTYWEENNRGKGWDDFLLAVCYHFAPEFTEDVDDEKQLGDNQFALELDEEVSQVIVDSQFGTQRLNVACTDIFANESSYKSIIINVSLNMNLESNKIFANGIEFDMDVINDVDPFHCIGTPKSYTDRNVYADLQLPNCEMDGGNLQVEARHIQGVFVDAATLIELYGDARAIPPRDDALLLRRNPIIGTAMPSLSSRLPIKIEPKANPLKDFGHGDSAAAAVPFSILHSVEPRGLFGTLTVHNQTSVSLDFLGGSAGGYTLLGQTAYRAWPDALSGFLPPIIMSLFILHPVPDLKDSAQLYQIVSEIELTHLLPKQSIKWPKVGTYKDMTDDGYSIFVKSGQHGKVILPQEVPMYQLETMAADGRSIPPREHLGRKSSSRRRGRLPPSQPPQPSSSFELLRNCVADTSDDSLEFSSVVCQRCDPSYYTIYLEERREYKLHEDEHGKDFDRCVAFFNKVRILFQITLLKFGSCYTRALEKCSCLNRFGCQMMNQLQYNIGGPNVQEFRSRCWGNRSCITYVKVLSNVMIFITWCCMAMVLNHESEGPLDTFGQGAQGFKNAVIVVFKLQHNNLAQSLEYGVKRNGKMVIYEFMPQTAWILILIPTLRTRWFSTAGELIGSSI